MIGQTSRITSAEHMGTVREHGAVLLKDFVSREGQQAITQHVMAEEMTPVARLDGQVAEQFQEAEWTMDEAPSYVRLLGQRICSLVRPNVPDWRPNKVRAQLYAPGEAGIDWHRDCKRDMRVIAIASFLSSAEFSIRLKTVQHDLIVDPGDLVLMRGFLLNGAEDDRPYHRIAPPTTGQRLSIAFREEVPVV